MHGPPSTHRTSLSISIVTFAPDLRILRDCLQRLAAAVAALPACGVTLYLVDNGPSGHAGVLARCLDDAFSQNPSGLVFELLSGHGNVGFGRGHNLAHQRAQSDWHLILNPDAELAGDALVRGIEHLRQDPSVVLVAGWTVGTDGRFQPLCKRHPSVRVLALRALGLRRFRHLLDAYDVQPHPEEPLTDVTGALVSGSFMLARTAALKAVGGFDPAFFLYFEDFDLSLRLARQGRLVWARDVRLVHHGGSAARKGWRHRWMFAVSAARFFQRHGWRW